MTKNNRKTIPIIAFFASALIIAAFLFLNHTGDEDDHNHNDPFLSLEQFKLSDQYQYGEIEWGASVDSVTSSLPYPIIINTGISGNLSEDVAYYISQNQFLLDGQSSFASFEFYEDKLKIVKFNFHLDENYEEWYNKQVEALLQLYGKESEHIEQSSSAISSNGYKWETEDTTLQIILLTGASIKPSAAIGVSAKQ